MVIINDELKREIEFLRNEVLLSQVDNPINVENSESKNLQLNLTDNIKEMIIYQNAPNPFNENTFVRCYIPKSVNKAQFCVYDMQGVQIKCLDVSERGNIEVKIDAGVLSSGIYTYLLIGDSKTSYAKNMILTK